MPESTAFTKILVPLDGSMRSEHALAYAATLSQPGSTVTLLHVDEPTGATAAMVEAAVEAQDGAIPIDDEAQTTALDDTAARWKDVIKGSVAPLIIFGEPETEILRTASDTGADLIIAATHGRGAIGRWAFGSVADDLARATTVPVLLARAKDEEIAPRPATIVRILFPFDGSELAATALPAASALAKQLGIPVHVISAYEPGPLNPMSSGMDVSYPLASYGQLQDELEQLAKEAAATAEAAFREAGVAVTSAVQLGPAAMTIEDSAAAGDLIVMTSRGRGGVTRALLGSVAEKLVRDAKAPTLLVPVAAPEPPAQ